MGNRPESSGLRISMMRVLVTGADGFVAQHLVLALRTRGHEVIGTVMHTRVKDDLDTPVQQLDITDAAACMAVVQAAQPQWVVHLAAVSKAWWSFQHPEETRRVNVDGTRHLLDAARSLPTPPRVLIVGSAEEYGKNDGYPLPELPLADLHPLSPYAESKLEVERQIEADPVLRQMTIRVRSFPHIGPGQQPGFFTADMASQLVRIERGETPPVLQVGTTDAVRDFTDVRDVVRAYADLLERGALGEVYNICSGTGVRIQEVLEELVRLAHVTVRVEKDPARLRPSEVPILIGDSSKLRAHTGWKPEIPLAQSLQDILAWWRVQERVTLPVANA